MLWPATLRGFYAILDRPDADLARALVDPARGAARILQVRIKPRDPLPAADILAAARMARVITRDCGALLVVNDRLDLALAADADAVHLGQTDLPLAAARALAARLRPDRPLRIGVSTHDADQVRAAAAGGADYIAYGPVFATATKANPDPVQGTDALRAAVELAGGIPVVAIGGITAATAAEVAATGAAAACVISAVNAAPDPVAAARTIAAAWPPS